MYKRRVLTTVAGIIDTIIGLVLLSLMIVMIVSLNSTGGASSFGEALGELFGALFFVIFAIIFGFIGALFLIYGIIFIIIGLLKSKNIKRKGTVIFVVAVIEYVIAGLILLSIILSPPSFPVQLSLSTIIAITATLKLLDSKKMEREAMSHFEENKNRKENDNQTIDTNANTNEIIVTNSTDYTLQQDDNTQKCVICKYCGQRHTNNEIVCNNCGSFLENSDNTNQ